MKPACAPALISSSDCPAHAKSNPGGRFCRASSSIACSACPELRPGAGSPVISAERNRLKWLMTCGAVVSRSRTTVSSGTICRRWRARVELLQVRRDGAEPLIGLHVDAIRAVVEVEVVDVLRPRNTCSASVTSRSGRPRLRARSRSMSTISCGSSARKLLNRPCTRPLWLPAPISPTWPAARPLMSDRRSGRAPRTGSRRTAERP